MGKRSLSCCEQPKSLHHKTLTVRRLKKKKKKEKRIREEKLVSRWVYLDEQDWREKEGRGEI